MTKDAEEHPENPYPDAPEEWPTQQSAPGGYMAQYVPRHQPLFPVDPPAGLYPTTPTAPEPQSPPQQNYTPQFPGSPQSPAQQQYSQQPPQPTYQAHQQYPPQPGLPTQGGVGTAGFAVALVSLFLPAFLGLAGGIVAVVLSAIALSTYRPGVHAGRGLAIAGLVVGIFAILLIT